MRPELSDSEPRPDSLFIQGEDEGFKVAHSQAA